MKEINGKIKFGVIPVNTDVKIIDYGKTNLLRSADDVNFIANKVTIEQIKTAVYLSAITEEQAAEFVECTNISTLEEPLIVYTNYFNEYKWFDKPKESLISLLKANDVWIKEWSVKPKRMTTNALSEKNKDRVLRIRERLYGELPDDLLLIKL